MSHESPSADQELDRLAERCEQLFEDCHLRSAMRVAREAARMARSRQRVIPYMRSLFDQMLIGHGLLEPQATRDAAVELIVLLQDEEQARRIQPDLDEGQYHSLCVGMTTCAFDNLAEATGLSAGFNSPGMHACIGEGLQICRQTGKLDCIRCFREYASDVYLAADDLPMVRHQCQWLLETPDDPDQHDRRWSAQHKLGWMALLEGRLARAEELLTEAVEMTRSSRVYLSRRAQTLVRLTLAEARALQGRDVATAWSTSSEGWQPDPAEWPRFDLEISRLTALQQMLAGDVEAALTALTDWDRKLSELHCQSEWFEIRLRIVAACLRSGQDRRAAALAKGLEARAHEAHDFLTLRRLERLLASGSAALPLPLLAESDVDGKVEPVLVSPDEDRPEPEKVDDSIIEAPTPLSEQLTSYMKRIVDQQDEPAALAQILEEVLSHRPDEISDAGDAAYLLHLSRFLLQDESDALRVWPWAIQLRERFPDDATVLSVVAAAGQQFRSAHPDEFAETISPAELEEWFRLSLALNIKHPPNHARAGKWFLECGDVSEAERCFARSFRLDRSDGGVARQLADIYRDSDRPRDALVTLDLCLRAETDDEHVAWDAAMLALQVEQFDSMLTYLDRFARMTEEQPWLHYYRALALFRLGRHKECLQAADQELQFTPANSFQLLVLRICALDQMGDAEEATRRLVELLELRLSDVDYISLHGIVRLSEQLWSAVAGWGSESGVKAQLVQRLLQAGLLPDAFFDELREQNPESDQVRFYRVRVLQPLDVRWKESPGRLAGQEDWTGYLIDWGVLAETEGEAVDRVLEFQNRCEPLAAEAVDVEASEERYRDRPGVVWQGYRRNERDEGTAQS